MTHKMFKTVAALSGDEARARLARLAWLTLDWDAEHVLLSSEAQDLMAPGYSVLLGKMNRLSHDREAVRKILTAPVPSPTSGDSLSSSITHPTSHNSHE